MAQPESRLRARCRMFLTSHLLHPCWFTAIEHGRKHAGTKEQRAREWQHMQSQGVKQGIGDMMVLAPGYVCFVELKAGKNKQSDQQHAFQAVMAVLGHGYALCRSVEQRGEALSERGIPLAPNWRLAAQHHDMALDGEPKAPRKASTPRAPRGNRKQVGRWNTAMLALARGPVE